MPLRILGPHPFLLDDTGGLKTRIATIFPRERTLVTLPGIHMTQRLAFLETIAGDGASRREAALAGAVDLILEPHGFLIRPDPARIPMIFEADEALQEIASKRRIRFLNVQDERVRQAVKERGECWRITPIPRSPEEMEEMIRTSKIRIAGRPIYHYNPATGSRWLTLGELEGLGRLDEDELRAHLVEIRKFSGVMKESGRPEVDFFLAGPEVREEFAELAVEELSGAALRDAHALFAERFRAAVPPELREDDPSNPEWRRLMFAALSPRKGDEVSEEVRLGLSPEFYMQIEWLPGARIEGNEVILDPVFEEGPPRPDRPGPPLDSNVRAFILNFVREYDDLEYVNVGRIVRRLSTRPEDGGRRDVYLVEMKVRESPVEELKILRMQKWGVWERLDEGRNVHQAYEDTEEYTEYVLDRRLGCRQLGMRLPARVIPRKISEIYAGRQPAYRGRRIWSPYFEREYVHGMATDKIPPARFAEAGFALRFAALLGEAAAPNIVVGRCQKTTDGRTGKTRCRVIFDDGDEILVKEGAERALRLHVTSHFGSFTDYTTPLVEFAEEYAVPVTSRVDLVPDPVAFAAAYADAFEAAFGRIQREVRRRPRIFEVLFTDRPLDEAGSFAYRWRKVLERLAGTDPEELFAELRAHLPRRRAQAAD